MPDHIVRQPKDLISSPFGHLRKALGFGLVLERVAREVDAGSVDICLDKNINAANTIQLDFFIFVVSPISKLDKIFSACIILLVALRFVSISENYPRIPSHIPSARMTSLSRLAARRLPLSDSIHEL
jgi:hypothetical protein